MDYLHQLSSASLAPSANTIPRIKGGRKGALNVISSSQGSDCRRWWLWQNLSFAVSACRETAALPLAAVVNDVGSNLSL
jgi:hypothetical protein